MTTLTEQQRRAKEKRDKAIILHDMKRVGDTSRGPENQPPKKFIRTKRSGLPTTVINPAYTKFMADQKRRGDIKTRPVKIDKKGLTPARTLAKDESKIRKSDINRSKPGDAGNPTKRKEEYDPRKANRAGQRMGQRKAGGTVKKYAQGGTAGVDYDKTKLSGGDKTLIDETKFNKLKRKIKSTFSDWGSSARGEGPGTAYDRLTNERMKIKRAIYAGGLTAAERKELIKIENDKFEVQFGNRKVKGSKILGVHDQFNKQQREDQASKRKADARIKANENLKGIRNMKKAGGSVKKMKHGGKVGMKKCPRDGIAMRGKTRAKRG